MDARGGATRASRRGGAKPKSRRGAAKPKSRRTAVGLSNHLRSGNGRSAGPSNSGGDRLRGPNPVALWGAPSGDVQHCGSSVGDAVLRLRRCRSS
jgi:hypothetical protein